VNYEDIGDVSADGTCVLTKYADLCYVTDENGMLIGVAGTTGRFFGEDRAAAEEYAQKVGRPVQVRRSRIWEPKEK